MTQDRLRDNPLRPARAQRALLCWLGARMWLEEAPPGASERARWTARLPHPQASDYITAFVP